MASRPNFYGLGLGTPMAFSSKVQAMALSCSDNCWRHAQTQGPTTDTKVTVKSVAVSFTFTSMNV